MSQTADPYAPPAARVEDVPATEAESIRRENIRHEAGVKSIGILYYLGGTICVLGGAFGMAGKDFVASLVLLLVGPLQIMVGWGIRRLLRWARVGGGILSGLGLLAFPFGTLINGYILYLLFSKKGAVVFSDAYKDVVAATPHVKHKVSLLVWIALALLVLFFAAIFAAIFIPSIGGR
jgi:hypothetical protein